MTQSEQGAVMQDAITTAAQATEVKDYWAALFVLWPVFIFGALVGVVRSLKHIASERTARDKIAALFLAGLPAGTLSLLAVMLIPALFGPEMSHEAQLGIAGLIGGLGTKGFDILLRRIFHLSIVDLTDPVDLKHGHKHRGVEPHPDVYHNDDEVHHG